MLVGQIAIINVQFFFQTNSVLFCCWFLFFFGGGIHSILGYRDSFFSDLSRKRKPQEQFLISVLVVKLW